MVVPTHHFDVHPAGYESMLATASRKLEGGGWAFEPKLDGWRALLHVGEEVTVYSRPGRDITRDLPQLAGLAGGAVPAGTVIDGELVAGSGRASSSTSSRPA